MDVLKSIRRGKMKTTKFFGLLVLVVTVLVIFNLSDLSKANAAEPIRLGIMEPLTGVYSSLAKTKVEGAMLAVEEINAAGGVLGGRKIEVIVRDDELKAEVAIRRAMELKAEKKIDLLAGTNHAGMQLAISNWAVKNNIGFFITSAATKSIMDKKFVNPLTWIGGVDLVEVVTVAADFAVKDKKWKKFYFLGADYTFGWELGEDWEILMKELGGQMVGKAFAPLGTTDFGPYISRIVAAKPDCVVFGNTGADAINALTAAFHHGLKEKMNLLFLHMTTRIQKGAGAEACEGVYFVHGTGYWDVDRPAMKALSKRWVARYGYPPDMFDFGAYTAIKEMFRAVEGAKTLDFNIAGPWLDAHPNFEGTIGPQRWMPYHVTMKDIPICKGKPPKRIKGEWDMNEVDSIKGYTDNEYFMRLHGRQGWPVKYKP
jgi:branched-chain amino acid transport system substrate-binding protein